MLKSKLIKLRKQKKLTQEQVASHIGIARTTYAMYEQGNREPDFETLIKFANYFETSTDYLLGLTNNPSFKYENDISQVITHENAHWNGKPLTPKQRKIALELLKTVIERIESGERVEDEEDK